MKRFVSVSFHDVLITGSNSVLVSIFLPGQKRKYPQGRVGHCGKQRVGPLRAAMPGEG